MDRPTAQAQLFRVRMDFLWPGPAPQERQSPCCCRSRGQCEHGILLRQAPQRCGVLKEATPSLSRACLEAEVAGLLALQVLSIDAEVLGPPR